MSAVNATSASPTTGYREIQPDARQYAGARELGAGAHQGIDWDSIGHELGGIWQRIGGWFGQGGDTSHVINGDASNAGQRTTRNTTDGKTIYVDPFESSRDVSIARERTVADDGRGNQYVTKDRLVFTTGAGNDNIQVAQNADGSLGINVNGTDYKVEMAQGQALALRTGAGDDVVNVASDVKVNLVVDGGDGDDTITTGAGDDSVDGGAGNDTIRTGAGSDYAFGGAGRDDIDAGAGNDVAYGGNGDDILGGGAGNDYLEGGAGNDRLSGAAGNDMLSGGRGDDVLDGGADDDVVYTGAGTDTVGNTGGRDTLYAQAATDKVSAATGASNQVVDVELAGAPGAKGVKVEGSDEFVARVQADLEMLRSSPTGRQMLAAFDDAAANGNTLTIRELQNEDNGFTMGNGGSLSANGRPGRGADATIAYNPSFHMDAFPAPVGVLYHEMSHAYDEVNGTFQPGTYNGPDSIDRNAGVPNAERQAVGLDNTGVAYDFDHDPSTPPTTANPAPLTENGLRTELGLPLRLHYAL